MALMPRGQPRSVPDLAGDLYDREMAKLRAQRRAEDEDYHSPLEVVEGALHDFQDGPKIKRPNFAQSMVPMVGSGWEAVADLQDRNYGGAAFNGIMAVAEMLPVGVAVKGLRAAGKGIGILKKGSVTAGAAAKKIRRVGLAGPGQEIHHTIPLRGTGRSVQDPRNHYALLKVMPKADHRRLTGKWAGEPRFDPLQRAWHGTTDWMKAVPVGVAGYAADSWENVKRPFDHPGPEPVARK